MELEAPPIVDEPIASKIVDEDTAERPDYAAD
jgi:hypothetical protein